MLKNYFKTAFRNLRKNPFYTSINIIGLSVGLATCLLIMLYVMDELSYDGYNAKAERIFRVNNEIQFGGNHFDMAVAPAQMGTTIVQEIPQVEQYTRFRYFGSFLVRKDKMNLRESSIEWADSTIFQVFTLPLIGGDPATALREPNSLVISEKIARKYFNRTDVVGKTLVINDTSNYTITGVMRDIPEQSHFNYDILVAASGNPDSRDDNWLSENWNTYILLKKGVDSKKIVPALDQLLIRHSEPLIKSLLKQDITEFKKNSGSLSCSLTPILDIHLHSNKLGELQGNGSIQYVYIFSAITLFILLIACINFMNLSTARSSNRAREVGVRKVLGSLRRNLISQFLVESLLISFIALLLSFGLVWAMLPFFNELAGKTMHINGLFHPGMLLTIGSLIILVGLLAGSYPAFFLSGFQPIDVLKGKLAKGFKGSWLRNSLVVFQFAISIILIVGTIVIYKQLKYIRNKDIGYNKDQVLIIKNVEALNTGANAFKEELMKVSGAEGNTMTNFMPVFGWRNNDVYFTSPALDQKTAMSVQKWGIDIDYLPTLDIKLLQGRNFSKEFLSDSGAIIINEAAAKFLATKELLNKKLYEIDDIKSGSLKERHIIGIVKNFNFSSLRDVITPLIMLLQPQRGSIALRIHANKIDQVLSQIKNKWQAMAPSQPFEYAFLDEEFNSQYGSEQKTGKLFISFAILAILIASLGLFGLVTYAAEQRTKEIGIRKVLGATVGYITRMLSKEFLKLVLVASAIAFPIGWWMMHKWLQDFAYRTDINWWIFATAGLIAALIALLTVSFQAVKAAMQNPIKSLRSE
jgi:putative ABC transport system permease protein